MHVYRNHQGVALPSVTEIIGKTRSLSEVIKLNKAIEGKKKRLGMTDKDWDNYMVSAQNRGTNTHTYLESYAPLVEEANRYVMQDGKVPNRLYKKIVDCRTYWESQKEMGVYAKQLTQFIRDLNKKSRDWSILSSEQALVNEALGYGGRCDTLLRLNNTYLLLDLKTNGGYWSSWKKEQVYGWNLWAKPKKVDVVETKVYANGSTRQVKKRDRNGKVIRRCEELPPVAERGWEWIDSKIRDKFVQLCLYILAAQDMKNRGCFIHSINSAAIVVAFPTKYQFLKMPHTVWEGCKEESIARVKQYMDEHLHKFRLEVAFKQDF